MKEGWKYKKFSEICSSIEDGDWIESKDQSQSGIRLVQTGNVGIGIYKDKGERAKYISEDTFKRLHCNEIFVGDVLISRLPDPVGRACILPRLETRCITAVDCSILRLKEEVVLPKWFVLYTQSDKYFSLVKSQCTGSTRLRITRKKLAELEIPVPLLSTQQEIVTYLDTAFEKIDRLKENAEKSLSDAKALFQSALKEMMQPKDGWKLEKVGKLFKTYAGGTPLKSSKEYYEGGNIPWLRSGEVCRKYITETEMFITEAGMENSSAKYYPIDTVVVAMYGATAAQVGILKLETTSNQAVCGILPNSDYIPEFVYYWFRYRQDFLAAQAQGGAQPNISQIKIKNITIPVIEKATQHSIVTTLDALSEKVSALEANYTQTIAECNALKQALLKQVFE